MTLTTYTGEPLAEAVWKPAHLPLVHHLLVETGYRPLNWNCIKHIS